MIEEKFLIAAVNIKKKYIDLTSNLNFYSKRTEKAIEKLQDAHNQIENLEKEIEDSRKNQNVNTELTSKLLSIFDYIEEEGNKIEKFVEPLNKEIEKLAVEEEQLYKRIIERHSDLSENQIVETVRLRLKKEGLS
jgi:predicted  nucleic acid-binding Zn-ribbon protein